MATKDNNLAEEVTRQLLVPPAATLLRCAPPIAQLRPFPHRSCREVRVLILKNLHALGAKDANIPTGKLKESVAR